VYVIAQVCAMDDTLLWLIAGQRPQGELRVQFPH